MASAPEHVVGSFLTYMRAALARRGKLGVSDVALAAFVLSVVAMMIVPLPTWLLDILLAANLSMGVAILLVVLYVPDALAIATFPTLLLLTTLFRLALNVSSARLILLQANAGEVISAFGNFVVRGNYVVGAVIFLILTIIQFVVITKGSERVAEVGARFVLDAMPGKQMAIDAELRSGAIDGNEARRRRHKLSRESQFYGAMDGASKFVKGDVIASVIITVINIIGGLAIGVLQKDMAAGTALKKYGLLTIGDGLVSQIPALVLSTAAGILVTRTASEDADTPLGQELGRQLLGTPKALTVASVFVVALGLVPGLPTLPFLVIGVALFFGARSRAKKLHEEGVRAAAEPVTTAAPGRTGPTFLPMVVPWSVEVSEDLAPILVAVGERQGLTVQLAELRERLFAELGVPLPAPRVRVAPLPPRHVALSLFEVPTRVLVLEDGLTEEQICERIVATAFDVLRVRAADFLGLSETQRLLDELEQFAGATVRNVVPKPVSVTLLVDVLRRLVEEGISIRDLRGILESLSVRSAIDKDPLNLTELVRADLRRPITFRLTGGGGVLSAFTMHPMIEDTIQRAITRTPAGAFLSIAPEAGRDIVTAVRRAFVAGGAPEAPILLVRPEIRRFVRRLLETEFPKLIVVTIHELTPEVSIRPQGQVTLVGL